MDFLKTGNIFHVPRLSRVSFSGRQPAPGKMQTRAAVLLLYVCVCAAQRVRVIIVNALLLAGGPLYERESAGVYFSVHKIYILPVRVPAARVNIFPATIFNSPPFENFSHARLFPRERDEVWVFTLSESSLPI